jgi:hypothetical protein
MSKTSSTSSGETKQDDTQLHFLGAKLIPSATTKEELISTDLVRWTAIFSYLHFNEFDRLSVRNLCRLFHTVLPGPTCAGVYTIFPHPNHASLRSLMSRLNEMARVEGINVEHLFLANGVHVIEDEYDEDWEQDCNIVNINLPISIIGESREHCIVMGGLFMNGNEEQDVNVSNLTLRDSKGSGVCGYDGASFHLDNVSVENSEEFGVVVDGSKRSTMKNCNVSHSKYSGLVVANDGLMTIDGNGTTIHHNCTNESSYSYGLEADSSCSIHLASSLTIETISKNNGGGGNHGGQGTIKTITNNTKEAKK